MNSPTENLIKKIVVLGGGSAGFLAATAIAAKVPDVELTVVRSLKMGVIGVGEGTIPSVVQFLHRFLGLDIAEFNREVRPSIKLGIKYYWGPRSHFNYTFSQQLSNRPPTLPFPKGYYCQDNFEYADLSSALMHHDNVSVRMPNGKPRHNKQIAYHLENKKFVEFFERYTDEIGVRKIDAVVKDVKRGAQGVASLLLDDGREIEGDLFIDCSGFRSELLGKCLQEPFERYDKALFCDKAVVGGWKRSNNDVYHPYTTAETMNAGWAWQIEHDELVNRGYVYCSSFLSDNDAISEFCQRNPNVKDPRVIEFEAGVRRRTWVDNVVAIGNSAGFVEPIEATAIGMVCDSVSRLIRGLVVSNGRILDLQRQIYNRINSRNWRMIRDFIALHYRFNTRLNTPFWEMCRNEVDLGRASEIANYYKHVGPDFGFLSAELKQDIFTAEGYLAMLVGQQVAYERTVDLDTMMLKQWQRHKNNLSIEAEMGVPMEEYLVALRGGGQDDQSGLFSQNAAETNFDSNIGELNWH